MTEQQRDNRNLIKMEFEDLAWGEVDRHRVTAEVAEMAVWLCFDWCEDEA